LTELNILNCNNNNINILEVVYLTKLTELKCGKNNISVLEVGALSLLENLECFENNIVNLNVIMLTKLERLDCNNNNINILNVVNLTVLKYLSCYKNNIDWLNIVTLVLLEYLNCADNIIGSGIFSTLNTNSLTKLKELHVNNNQLSGFIIVSGNPDLDRIDCSHNKLDRFFIQAMLDSLDSRVGKTPGTYIIKNQDPIITQTFNYTSKNWFEG
jgi:Leucine-rich repeat (LRR) protein